MTRISLSVKNAQLVRQGLQKLTDEIPKIGRQSIYEAALRIQKSMRNYPPERPLQTYVRTYKLRDGWEVDRTSDIGYRVSNKVPYTKYVVGDSYGIGQAWMHQNRWQLFRDEIDKEVKLLPPEVERALGLVARRHLK